MARNGNGQTSARTPASQGDANAVIEQGAFSDVQGLELWRQASRRLEGSRNRMLEAQDISLGNIQLAPPKHLTRHDKNLSWLIPLHPMRKQLVLNMTNTIRADWPVISRQRPPKGGTTAEQRSEEIETSLNALMDELFPRQATAGRAVQHAQFAIVTLLAEDAWDAAPESDDVLGEDDYGALSKKEQSGYRKADADDGSVSYKRTRSVYWRDSAGRGVEHPDYTRRDPGRTQAAYEADKADYLAQHPPFAIRGYSAFDFAFEKDGEGKVTYLGVRQLMDVNMLVERGYRWKGLQLGADGKARAVMPTGFDGQYWGRGTKLWLYQHYLWIDGDPCVKYQVGGQDTQLATSDDGELEDAVINLREKWGFCRLPVGVYDGQHLETDNPDDRPVPFMEPIGPSIVALEGLVGSTNITAWRRGTSKIGVVPDPKVPPAAYVDANNNLKPIDIDADADVVTLFGPVQSIAPLEHSGDTRWVASELGAAIAQATPAPAASGQGSGTNSGREAAILHAYAQAAQDMTREAIREACEDSASFLLEWACCFMRTRKLDEIPFYADIDVEPQEGNDSEGKTTVVVRLVEQWIGKNYKVTAEYLPSPNPVMIEQEVSLAEKGYGSFDDVQRARGKTNPLRERVKAVNDVYWRSERGQMELSALDARQRGDVERAKALDAWLSEQATPLAIGPDGKPIAFGPTAAMDPMFQGAATAPQGNGAAGGAGGGPTSAQAAYAGTIGGGRAADMGDAVLQAGLPAPAGAQPAGAVPAGGA